MTGLWQSMPLWKRVVVGAVPALLFLAGAMVFGNRIHGGTASELPAGDRTAGALCPAPLSAGDASPEAPEFAGANDAWTPSGGTELATFALG